VEPTTFVTPYARGEVSLDLQIPLEHVEHAYEKAGVHDVWPAERDAVAEAIAAIAQALPRGRYNYQKILGVGGSGIVIRLSDVHFPATDKAIKFPRPVPGKVAQLAELVSKEIALRADLRHPGIVRIFDYDSLGSVATYPQLPFYIMEAIEGQSSRDWVNNSARTPTDLFRLFVQTLDTIRYLHTHGAGGVAHLDLKPENIVIDADGRPIMIDLGTCKRVTAEDTATIIACTRRFASPELAAFLREDPSDDNRDEGTLPRSSIKTRWDLWSFALTLASWLGFEILTGECDRNAVLNRLPPYWRKFLLLFAARLLANEPEHIPLWLTKRINISDELLRDLPIRSAAEAVEVLRRLDGTSNPIDAVPELAERAHTTIQSAPGIHVALTPRLQATLDHPLIRRLTAIAQLGLVVAVYPEASHSRREHSVGTYGRVAIYVRSLYNDPISPLFRQLVTEADLRDVLLAALLHDIGHFPLAHDLEDIDRDLFDHADLTVAMLRGAFDKKKRGFERITFVSLEELLDGWETSAERIIGILQAKPRAIGLDPKRKLLRSLISGPVDADKLDYLFRDAQHMHIPYPLGIDVDRLYRCLTVVVIGKLDTGATNVPLIGVHQKGKVAAEFVSIARYAMFAQGYWHHAVRAIKAMLSRAVYALFVLLPEDDQNRLQSAFVRFVASLPESLFVPPAQQRSLFEALSIETDAAIDVLEVNPSYAPTDVAVLNWLHQRLVEARKPEALLIRGILVRRLFKRLWVVNRDMQEHQWDQIIQRWSKLDRNRQHRVHHELETQIVSFLRRKGAADTTASDARTALDRMQARLSSRTPWLLVDIPVARPGSDVGLYYVLEGQRRQLRKDDRVVGELQESKVWKQYSEGLLEMAGTVRVFCDPDLVDVIETSITWEKGMEILVAVISNV
jgi:HD superfamily phosphohydrolase